MRSDVSDEVPAEPSPHDALQYADVLFHLARRLTGDGADAEDLVQETYARAYQAWSRLETGSDIRAWLFRILRNAFLSSRRTDRRHPTIAMDECDELPDDATGDDYVRGDLEVDRLRRVVAGEIEAALATLSPDARMIVLLDLEGFTHSELADVMGCPPGTIKSRLSRARARLRRCLAAYDRGAER